MEAFNRPNGEKERSKRQSKAWAAAQTVSGHRGADEGRLLGDRTSLEERMMDSKVGKSKLVERKGNRKKCDLSRVLSAQATNDILENRLDSVFREGRPYHFYQSSRFRSL